MELTEFCVCAWRGAVRWDGGTVAVLFLQNNASSVSRAMALQTQFYAQFGLEGKDNCTGNAGDPFNKGDMVLCAFDTAWDADGPFPTAQ